MEFDQNFPERYDWQLLDSRKLTKAAQFIQAETMTALSTPGRHLVPGLRKALKVIYSVDQCSRDES